MTADLFDWQDDEPLAARHEALAPGACVLRGFARPQATALLAAVAEVTAHAPFRHLITPGGFRMSVGMSNCGPLGWVSSRAGYRYTPQDPHTEQPWPAMPKVFLELAQHAALQAGFEGFEPEVCLINRYAPGTKLSLHQDRDEGDLIQPIVSVSLGLPATFLFGGLVRSDATQRIALAHGDVVVWGGPSRMRYHGVLPVKEGHHPDTGAYRFNLSFRRVNASHTSSSAGA